MLQIPRKRTILPAIIIITATAVMVLIKDERNTTESIEWKHPLIPEEWIRMR